MFQNDLEVLDETKLTAPSDTHPHLEVSNWPFILHTDFPFYILVVLML